MYKLESIYVTCINSYIVYCILVSFDFHLVFLVLYIRFVFPKYGFLYGSLDSESFTSDFDSVYIYVLNLILKLNFLFY
jgi:hypothetical protein